MKLKLAKNNINDGIIKTGIILSITIHVFRKDLITANQDKNEQLANNITDGLIDLRNAINRNKFLKMKIQIK